MSEFKFACPACGQRIAGDVSWAGAQIKCPVCQADMQVPKPEGPAPSSQSPVPVPASSSPMRLSLSASPAAQQPKPAAAPAPAPFPTATSPHVPGTPKLPLPKHLQTESQPGKLRAALPLIIILAVAAVAVVVLLPFINRTQENLNEARKKEVEESGGGQVGHLAELKNVLDATEIGGAQKREKPKKEPPPQPWSLEPGGAIIPAARVRGKVMATTFECQDAVVEITNQVNVLTIRQLNPFREMIVSLRLRPGENIQNKNWVITKETTTGAPPVAKKWKTDPNAAVSRTAYASGYSLKLQFGNLDLDGLEGKIYLALPDAEQSVISGEFRAAVRMADGTRPKFGTTAFDQ